MNGYDNQGRLISQIEHLRDGNGNTVDTLTSYQNGRPVVQVITIRDTQGRVENRTIMGGKLIP